MTCLVVVIFCLSAYSLLRAIDNHRRTQALIRKLEKLEKGNR